MSDYHEPFESLSETTRSHTRALKSLIEEIEAIDWYNQRYDVEKDKSLKNILKHNMEEEMEHACMALEWLRRNMNGWDKELKDNLFKEGEIGHH